eukprot:SAG31_NODE_973_length_10632_cov_7.175622_3_plen_54_part_00
MLRGPVITVLQLNGIDHLSAAPIENMNTIIAVCQDSNVSEKQREYIAGQTLPI